MRNKVLIMIGLAILFGTASIFVADAYLNANQQTAQTSAPALPSVDFETLVVAAKPLRYGDPLTADALAEIPWPRERFPEGAYRTIADATTDGERVVLAPISENEPVLLTKLSGPDGRAALSNMLGAGQRAVTVRVDEIAGVGGFITPGDRVDVVLTRDEGGTTLSEVILQNIKVLSTDHMADTSETGPRATEWVTLEVDSGMARKITLARSIGSLSLSLRAAGDETIISGGRTTIEDLSTAPRRIDRQIVSSVTNAPTAAVTAPAPVVSEPELRTLEVIVTRALESTPYTVPDEARAIR